MIPPKIAALPPAPVRADAPVDFSAKADAMVGALQPFADQANTLAEFVNDRADDANASATSVAGVQSAVSADRVLSQQAASNAAGSAAAALNSANNASGSATAAQLAANASEASAVRAEDAAQYVENIAGGAAPINNPNFTGVVRVNSVPLGYAALASTVGDGAEVMRAGAYGLGGVGATADFKSKGGINQFFSGYLDPEFYGIHAGLTLAYSPDWWTQIISRPNAVPDLSVRSFHNGTTYSPIFTLYHSGNLLNIGTTAATARTALNLFADASGVMTNGPGQLSNDMSDFLSSMTFDDMAQKVGAGSAPRPTKDHGNVAVAGSQTVTCNVQESDFHIMSMGSSDAAGTLTIDFSNMPDTLGKHFSWHVRLQRGARKTVAFAQTINWAGGVAPTFGSGTSSQDLMMFYKVGSETIRGMVIDAW